MVALKDASGVVPPNLPVTLSVRDGRGDGVVERRGGAVEYRISQTDANSRSTSYIYDSLNRRTRRTLTLGQAETFLYDPVGNPAELTSR